MLKFSVTKDDMPFLVEIATRAVALTRGTDVDYTMQDAMMDIEACHSNGCPLKLRELSAAKASDLSHDVFGIRKHLDRTTGVLQDCFLPRYAA